MCFLHDARVLVFPVRSPVIQPASVGNKVKTEGCGGRGVGW